MIKLLSSLLFIFILFTGCENLNSERELENITNNRDNYNKEVDREILKTYFPKQQNYKFSTSGISPYIQGECPVLKMEDKYFSIDYLIADTAIANTIAVLNVYIEKKYLINGKIIWKAVVDKYFLPDLFNNVQLKNNLPKGEYKLWYGFYLKSDSLNTYPKLHKKVCYFSIE